MTGTFNCPSCGGVLVDVKPGEALTRCPYCNSNVIVPQALRGGAAGPDDPARREAASAAIQEIGNFLSRGQKIDAIRLYRQVFDTGLKEAKNAVETLEAGAALPIPASFNAPSPSIEPGVVLDDIREMLRQGKKIDAIKRYREAYPVGLKEAKDAVEAIDVGHWSPPPPSPSFSGYRMEDQQLAHFARMVAESRAEEAVRYYRKVFDTSAAAAHEMVARVQAGQNASVAHKMGRPASLESALSDLAARPEAETGSGRRMGRRLTLLMGFALAGLFFIIFAAILAAALSG